MEFLDSLYQLCETLGNELERVNAKLDKSSGELTGDDMSYIQKLTHSLKSIKSIIAMEDSGYSAMGYSREGGNMREGGSYRGNGGSYRGNSYARGGSYARGRGSNARRDSMGRYSSDGGMVDELHELLEDAPNEAVRRDIQRLIDKMEQM